MMRSKGGMVSAAALAVVLFFCFGQSLYADDPIVGVTNSANCIPFSCDAFFGISTYQQVYASSAFAGVTPFNQISFFLGTSGGLDFGTYDISFSYTSQAVNALSSASPGANIGLDETAFGTYVLGGGVAPSTLTFAGNTFGYDPSQGNLLMTIAISGALDTYFGGYDSDVTGSVTSRAYFGSTTEVDSSGLVTGFNDVAVPEPGSILLLGTLLLGLGGATIIKRK